MEPNPSSQESTPNLNSNFQNKSSKLPLIIFFTAVALILLSIAAYYIGGKKLLNKTPFLSLSNNPQQANIQQGETFTSPIKTDLKGLKSYGFAYSFNARIVGVRKDSKGSTLITDISSDPGIPTFMVSNKTRITSRVNGKDTPIKADSLKIGQNVMISELYNLKTKQWATLRVVVLQESSPPPSATKSANER